MRPDADLHETILRGGAPASADPIGHARRRPVISGRRGDRVGVRFGIAGAKPVRWIPPVKRRAGAPARGRDTRGGGARPAFGSDSAATALIPRGTRSRGRRSSQPNQRAPCRSGRQRTRGHATRGALPTARGMGESTGFFLPRKALRGLRREGWRVARSIEADCSAVRPCAGESRRGVMQTGVSGSGSRAARESRTRRLDFWRPASACVRETLSPGARECPFASPAPESHTWRRR